MRKQRGITLIALVVTIIVLIILAGVSINAFLGEDGVITIARQAKENMQLAQMEEQTKLNILYSQIGDEDGLLGGTSYDAIAKLAEFKRIIAEAITNKGVPTSETDSAEKMASNIAMIGEEGISIANLEVGDYIKYDTGVTTVGENGVIWCRVLYNDATNGLQIISNGNVSRVTLGGSNWDAGKAAYNSGIVTLNNEAEKYLNKAYAYDARCVGSLPTINSNGIFTEKDKGTETTVVLPISAWISGNSSSSSSSSDYTRPYGWTSDDTGCYDEDINHTKDEENMKNFFNTSGGDNWWLASRCAGNSSGWCGFGMRVMNVNYTSNNTYWCNVYKEGNCTSTSYTYGLRACFSIRSDVKIIGNGGKTPDTAYIITN